MKDRDEEIFAILRPTSPFRTGGTIRRAYERLVELGDRADSIRAVEPARQHPGKMWTLEGDLIEPLLPQPEGETPLHSRQYQALPKVYAQNSSLELAWSRVLDDPVPTISGQPRGAVLHRGRRGLLDRLPGRRRARRAPARARRGRAAADPRGGEVKAVPAGDLRARRRRRVIRNMRRSSVNALLRLAARTGGKPGNAIRVTARGLERTLKRAERVVAPRQPQAPSIAGGWDAAAAEQEYATLLSAVVYRLVPVDQPLVLDHPGAPVGRDAADAALRRSSRMPCGPARALDAAAGVAAPAARGRPRLEGARRTRCWRRGSSAACGRARGS